MKKSIWAKLLLVLVIGALMVCLVACGDKDEDDPLPPTEKTTLEQLVDVVKGVEPLLDTLNGITKTSTLGVSADIEVAYGRPEKNAEGVATGGTTTAVHKVSLAGNIDKSDPQLDIRYSNGESASSQTEYLRLAYLAEKLYLTEPLTAVNTPGNVNSTLIDLTTVAPGINSLMSLVMDMLDGASLSLDVDEMSQMIMSFAKNEKTLATLVTITPIEGGTELKLTSGLFNMVLGLISGNEIVDTLVNVLFDTKDGTKFLQQNTPDVYIRVYLKDNAISGISFGYNPTAASATSGSVKITLNKFGIAAADKVAISAPSGYKDNVLTLDLAAGLPVRGLTADAKVEINPNLSSEGNLLAIGALTFNTTGSNFKVNAYYGASELVFDMGAVYDGLVANGGSITSDTSSNVYSAGFNLAEEFNKWAAKLAAGEVDDDDDDDDEDETKTGTEYSYTLLDTIYEMLGGTVNEKVETTELKILELLKDKYQKYCKFTILTGKENTFMDTVDEIVKIFNANEKMITEDVLNWNTDDAAKWFGGMMVSKSNASEKDLFDVVNLFFKQADNSAVDVTLVADFLNPYIARLAYFEADGVFKTALDAIYDTYEASGKTDADKTTFDNAIAALCTLELSNKYMKEILGYNGTTDYLKEFITSGIYINIGCEKNNGLNGYLKIQESKADASATYLSLGGKIAIAAKGTSFAKPSIGTGNVVSLTAADPVGKENRDAIVAELKKIYLVAKGLTF